jgi:hypothetical protein
MPKPARGTPSDLAKILEKNGPLSRRVCPPRTPTAARAPAGAPGSACDRTAAVARVRAPCAARAGRLRPLRVPVAPCGTRHAPRRCAPRAARCVTARPEPRARSARSGFASLTRCTRVLPPRSLNAHPTSTASHPQGASTLPHAHGARARRGWLRAAHGRSKARSGAGNGSWSSEEARGATPPALGLGARAAPGCRCWRRAASLGLGLPFARRAHAR